MSSRTLAKRLILLAAIAAIGAVVWFMLGESEKLTAGEASGQTAADTDSRRVLARVNGVEITAATVEESIAGQLLKLERDRHDMIAQAVEVQVRDLLLHAEAEARGLSKEQLIETEVGARLAKVPAADVDAFYEARKQQIRAPKERVEERIRRFLGYESYIVALESAAEIELLAEPFRVEVAAVGPSKGPADAPITIVEFSDFECPFCGRVNSSIDQVRDVYGDKVRFVFRQFPLDNLHRNARKAGEAALCAADQGEFWAMHDAMFDDQKNLAVDGLKSIAGGIAGLDAQAFSDCLDSSKYAEAVEKDVQEGARAGVSSTPAFFINGRYAAGALSFESFAEVIDDELGRSDGAQTR